MCEICVLVAGSLWCEIYVSAYVVSFSELLKCTCLQMCMCVWEFEHFCVGVSSSICMCERLSFLHVRIERLY